MDRLTGGLETRQATHSKPIQLGPSDNRSDNSAFAFAQTQAAAMRIMKLTAMLCAASALSADISEQEFDIAVALNTGQRQPTI